MCDKKIVMGPIQFLIKDFNTIFNFNEHTEMQFLKESPNRISDRDYQSYINCQPY